MSVFEFSCYKTFLNSHIEKMPNAGRGQVGKMATKLRVHSSLVSQVLAGKKDFTREQAAEVCDHLDLSTLDTDYFLLLVDIERAGSSTLKKHLERQKKVLMEKSLALSEKFKNALPMTEEDRVIFYSSWRYSAIRLLTGIEQFRSPEAIAKQLNLPLQTVNEALDFLLKLGLVKKNAPQNYESTPVWTFVAADSVHATRNSINWRVRSLSTFDTRKPSDVSFTLPMTHSEKDRDAIRKCISDFVANVKAIVGPSPRESLSVMTLDFFSI